MATAADAPLEYPGTGWDQPLQLHHGSPECRLLIWTEKGRGVTLCKTLVRISQVLFSELGPRSETWQTATSNLLLLDGFLCQHRRFAFFTCNKRRSRPSTIALCRSVLRDRSVDGTGRCAISAEPVEFDRSPLQATLE